MSMAVRRFLADDDGATMIEYGLVAALVSVAAITALQSMGQSLQTLFAYVTDLSAAATQPRT